MLLNNPISYSDPTGLAPQKEKGGGNRLMAIEDIFGHSEYVRKISQYQGNSLIAMLGREMMSAFESIVGNQHTGHIIVNIGEDYSATLSDLAAHRMLFNGRLGTTESDNGFTGGRSGETSKEKNILKDIWGWFSGLFASQEDEVQGPPYYKHIDNFEGVDQLGAVDCGFANMASIALSLGMKLDINDFIKKYEDIYGKEWRNNGGAQAYNLEKTSENLDLYSSGHINGELNGNKIIESIDYNESVLAGMHTIFGNHYITFTGYKIFANGERKFEYWDSTTGKYQDFHNRFSDIQPLYNNVYGIRYLIKGR